MHLLCPKKMVQSVWNGWHVACCFVPPCLVTIRYSKPSMEASYRGRRGAFIGGRSLRARRTRRTSG